MNKAIMIGRLTKDPELRYAVGSGTAVTHFTLAINRPKNKDGKVTADFIPCVAFGKTAETIAQYLTKGRMLAIEGNIRTGSYEAQDGTKRYTTEVFVEKFFFIDSGKGNSNPAGFSEASSFGESSYTADDDMTPADDTDIPF